MSARADSLPGPTERLSFRKWRIEDEALALVLWGDPRVTALVGGPFSEAQVRQRLATEIAQEQEHGVQYWPVFLIGGSEHVGCCGLRPYAASPAVLEIGFHLRPEHWGKGYAGEAARAVIAYAFDALATQSLFAGHHPDNAASRTALERLGFQYVRDELYPPTGRHHPSYALTRAEYLTRVSSAAPRGSD